MSEVYLPRQNATVWHRGGVTLRRIVPTRGPIGCLTGCLTRFVLILAAGVAAGVVFVVAIDYVFAPWSFYFGGQFHLVPGWQGIGTMHTDAGDYVLYVWFTP